MPRTGANPQVREEKRETGPNRLSFGRSQFRGREQLLHKEPISRFRWNPAGGTMRLKDEPFFFQMRHVFANGGAAHP